MFSLSKRFNCFLSFFVAMILLLSDSKLLFIVGGAEMTLLNKLNETYDCSLEKDQVLTREEFCVIVAKVFADTQNSVILPPFEDVEQIKPQNIAYIAALYNSGILSGSEINGRLYMFPDSEIARQEAFTLLGKTINQTSQYTLRFTDSDSVAPWAYGYISWFAENEILIDNTDGRLAPNDNMIADHLAILIFKTLEYKNEYANTGGSGNVYSYFGLGSHSLTDGNSKTARFTMPYGIAVDKSGSLIVFDTYNNAIRVISNNVVSTLTGSIKSLDENRLPKGYYLDDSLKSALYNRPTTGAYNSQGELFICDSKNHVIRLIKNGRAYTFTGTNDGYGNGSPKDTRFNNPMAIAIDNKDNIYVADTLNNCIRKIDKNGNSTTVAGVAGSQGFADGDALKALFLEPSGIAVSGDGSTIYVSDTGNQRIRKIENNMVTTIAGGSVRKDSNGYYFGGFKDGDANEAIFNQPMGLTLVDGVLIIADSANNKIRAITKSGRVITIAGDGEPGDKNGSPLAAQFNQPMGTCYSNGTLYIADTINNKIKAMTFDANVYEEAAQ